MKEKHTSKKPINFFVSLFSFSTKSKQNDFPTFVHNPNNSIIQTTLLFKQLYYQAQTIYHSRHTESFENRVARRDSKQFYIFAHFHTLFHSYHTASQFVIYLSTDRF